MHIRCICHKFALIVNAGLQALSLKKSPPGKTKQSVLGFFPVLGKLPKVAEEDKTECSYPDPDPDVQEVNQLEDIYEELEAEEAYESDYGNADDEELSHESESEGHPDNDAFEPENSIHPTSQSVPAHSGGSKHIKSAKLRDLTTQLDVVIKQITRSAAQRSLFKQTAKTMGIQCPPLIAGYGIRWNIKYKSHRRALLGQEVIDQILKDDQESFDNITFSASKWQDIQELNWELEVFVRLTQEMEGNHSSGAHVIPKYLELKEDLAEKLNAAHKSDALYPMYCAMTKQVSKYRDKAMACDTLVHPCFQITLFILVFGQDSLEVAQCNNLIQREFARIKETISSKAAEHLNPIPATQKKQATSSSTDS
ncbi:hypothetical protein Pst134EA_030401 [Puccinia striiformis f. sp. tritici]|uniref:hypothetical protein n=1 Tax=Puccinia striiformis f. sp. tritici TaxID=168172 RepID=UPI0020080251|nr:hypothetical protein Pst134EA_030401 [Puccinia striiformis f. sp. tritici]KAH9446484.1 hypothetical protein Pst134EA_030401 [Puccinia striiformis f. sp. tritici]